MSDGLGVFQRARLQLTAVTDEDSLDLLQVLCYILSSLESVLATESSAKTSEDGTPFSLSPRRVHQIRA